MAEMQKTTPQSSVARWLDEHLGLSALYYEVPAHANTLPYLLGGISFVGFLVLIITGIWLAQYYHPHPTEAHESVVYIITKASLGDFIRSLHFWASNLVIVTVLLHMIRIFITASYKHPREINWLVGLGLLAVTIGFIFTSTVLKWDQEGYEAMVHNTEMAELVGRVGSWFSTEFTRSVPLLTRLYMAHVSILPIALVLLLLLHFFLIKRHGVSPLPRFEGQPYDAKKGPTTFVMHQKRMLGYGLLIFVTAAGLLAVLWPAPLGMPPVPGAEVTKPPWLFYWIYAFEDWGGIRALLLAPFLFFLLLALAPFVDRSAWLRPRRRMIFVIAGTVLLLGLIGLSFVTALTPQVPHTEEMIKP